jgi:hypothetical protein
MQALPNRFDRNHRDYQWSIASFALVDTHPGPRRPLGVLVATSARDSRAID